MNLFEAVKDAIPIRTAAEHYGIEVKRNGMAFCPFHDGRMPSFWNRNGRYTQRTERQGQRYRSTLWRRKWRLSF